MAPRAGSKSDALFIVGLQYENLSEADLKKAIEQQIRINEAIGRSDRTQKKNLATVAAWALGWKVAYGAINTVTDFINKSLKSMVAMEKEMAFISVVSGKMGAEIRGTEIRVRELAAAMGISSTEVAKAARIYVQQGIGISKALDLTEIAMRGVLVTGQTTTQMVENLTAAQRGFNLSQRETSELLDKWIAVSQQAPVSADVLASTYRRVSAAAADLGVNVDQLNALTAGLAGTMRLTGQQSGTALATIFMRMQRAQSIGVLQGVADVEAVAPGGRGLRSPFEVLTELASKWDQLSGAQRRVITQQVAGIRRGKEFVALLRSWGQVERSLADSIDARSNALRASEQIIETTAQSWERLKEAGVNAVAGMGSAVASLTGGKPAESLGAIADQFQRASEFYRDTARVVLTSEQEKQVQALMRGRTHGPSPYLGPWAWVTNAVQNAAMGEVPRLTREEALSIVTGGRTSRIAPGPQIPQRVDPATGLAPDIGTFGEGSFAAQLGIRRGVPQVSLFRRALAGAFGVPAETGGGIPLMGRDIFRLGAMGIGGAGARAGALAGGGLRGARASVEISRRRVELARQLTEQLKAQADIGAFEGGEAEARLLSQQAIRQEVDATVKLMQAQLGLQTAIARETRAAANAFKGAFGSGLKAFISGEGTVSDIFSGVGEAAFERNIDALVDRLDSVFLGLGQTEQDMIRQGGMEAAGSMGRSIRTSGAMVAHQFAAAIHGKGSIGGGPGGTAVRDPATAKMLAGISRPVAKADMVFPSEVSAMFLREQGSTFPISEIPSHFPAVTIDGRQMVWSPDHGAYIPKSAARGAGAGAAFGRFALGALQGYQLSGGRPIGAIASGVGAMLPGVAGQIGALAGALFRRSDVEPEEQRRVMQLRQEWQNAVLENLVLISRNTMGLNEGGTFALPESAFYAQRTVETMATELELTMRG